MKYSFLTLLLALPLLSSTAVSQSILKTDWKNELTQVQGQKRVDFLLDLTGALIREDLPLAESLAYEGITLAEQLGDSLSMYRVTANLGSIYYKLREKEKSLTQLLKSLDYFTRTKSSFDKAKSQLSLASLYIEQKRNDKADSLILLSESYFRQTDNKLWQSKTLQTKGFAQVYQNDYNESLYYYEEALKLVEGTEDIDQIASTLGNIGLSKKQLALYPEALELLFQANSMECTTYSKAIHHALISQIYEALQDWDMAVKHSNTSIEKKKIVGMNSSLAYSYYDLGTINIQQLNYGDALKNLEKSLVLAKQYSIERIESNILGALGNTHNELNNPEKANRYYKEQLELAKSSNNLESVYLVYYNQGYFAFQAKRYEEALEHLLDGYKIATENNYVSRLVDNNAMLANTYEQLENTEKAKFHEEQYYIFKDSISSIKKIKKIGALEQEYFSKKEDSLTSSQTSFGSESNENNTAIKYAYLVIGLMLIGLLWLLYGRTERNTIKEAIVNKESNNVEAKLDNYFDELFSLLNVKEISKKDNVALPIRDMAEFLKKKLNSSEDWTAFEEYFEKVHKDFFKNLKIFHPSMSTNDLNMCALLKLNLRNKDIAQIMMISHDSVRKAQSRLSRKMDVPEEETLRSFILKM